MSDKKITKSDMVDLIYKSSDIEKKVEEALPKEAKSERRTEATSKLSSEDLDKLLSGETLDK